MIGDTKELPPFKKNKYLQRNSPLFAALTAASKQLRQTAFDRNGVFKVFRDNFSQNEMAGAIALFKNKDQEQLVFHVVANSETAIIALQERFKYSAEGMHFLVNSVDVYQQVVSTRQPVYLSNTSSTHAQLIPTRLKPFSKLILNSVHASAGIYAPLISNNELIGVILIRHDELTELDIPFVLAFADRIAQALENALLYQTQRQMHTALVSSRDAWHRLIQQTPIGIQIFDPSGYCTEMNEAFLEIYNVTRQQIIGVFNIFRDPLAKKIGTASAARLALRGETVELENVSFSPVTGSSKKRTIDITIFPVYDNYGAIVNLVSLNTDVTARKEADLLQNALYQIAALATSEGSLQELYSHIHVIISELMAAENFFIAIHDEKTNMIHLPYFVDEEDDNDKPYPFNNGLIEYVIRTGEALLINDEQHRQLMKEGKADIVGPMGPIWLGAPLRTKERTFGVIAVQHYKDEQAYTNYHKQILIFVSGQIAAAINRKRAEEEVQALALRLEQQAEELDSMLTTTRTHFYIYDRQERITYISPSALKTFNVTAESVLKKSWDKLPFPISIEFATWMRAVFTSHAFATQELWLTSNGALRCYEVQINPIREKNGHVEKAVMNMLDITDKKMTQETLLHAQKIESLGILAGGVAHDFNNLLVALMGQSSLALAKLPPDSASQIHLEKTIKVAEQATELTQQLLAYSGKGSFTMKAVNLNDLIHENSHLIDVAIPKTITLSLDLYDDLPDIEADLGQMQQIVMNLILNAVEAIPNHGTVWITTGMQKIEANDETFSQQLDTPLTAGHYAYLRVADDGIGMNGETLTRLFDPFYTTKFTGRGLGLAAVLGIVRGHRGGILVSSNVGKGTVFHLLFPTAKTAVSTPQQPIPVTTPASSPASNKNHLILLIDDEYHVREAVTDILEMEDIKVLSAANGQTGIDLYLKRKDEIDLILLDLSMPGLSGHETFVKLRKIDETVKVILSSGFSKEEVHQQFAGEDVADFLSKPYHITTLIDKISYHLVS